MLELNLSSLNLPNRHFDKILKILSVRSSQILKLVLTDIYDGSKLNRRIDSLFIPLFQLIGFASQGCV